MRAVAIVALALGVVSCSEPEVSQIIVRIEADPGVVAMTRSLTVFVDGGPNSDVLTRVETITLGGNGYPRQIALAPRNDDPTRYYRVVARAQRRPLSDPTDTTFAQAALIGTYIRGETRTVVLRIEDSCIDVPCGETQHCTDSDCVEPPDATPGPLDGGMTDMSMPDMGAASCTIDADCDDGFDCTNDNCTLGRCTYETDASRCAEPGNQCLQAVCVVGVGCSEEARTGLCDDGDFCSADDTCVGGVCMGSGDRCPGLTCDEDADACVGCERDEDCTNGEVCSSTVCTCPSAVEMCGNDVDDDCDGDVDCADFDCDGESCGANGFECTPAGVCDCPQSGPEDLCMNGMDDDCDGQVDCLDDDCDGATCMSGMVCIDRSCQDEPEFDGGVMEMDLGSPMDPDLGADDAGICMPSGSENDEFACDDGEDNDCDGEFDCDDAQCMTLCVCGGFCDAGSPGPEDFGMSVGLDEPI